jgi:high-affinity Fe2+/Pb2+ permease
MSAMRVMQIGAGFVLIFIIGGLFYYWRRERTSNGNDWDEVLKQQHRI